MSGDWTLTHGDCLDTLSGMASLADKSVDHVICDPPYGPQVDANYMTTVGKGPVSRGGKIVRRRLGIGVADESLIQGLAFHAGRLARRWVLVWTDEETAHAWRVALVGAGLQYLRTGWWLKTDPTPQFTGDRPATPGEVVVICHADAKRAWNGGGKAGVWIAPTVKGTSNDRVHPTQKPLALMESLIRDFTDPGELVLDPFAGSGTTGVACRRMGRRFVGWERDAKYHAIAERRIGSAREQLTLGVG